MFHPLLFFWRFFWKLEHKAVSYISLSQRPFALIKKITLRDGSKQLESFIKGLYVWMKFWRRWDNWMVTILEIFLLFKSFQVILLILNNYSQGLVSICNTKVRLPPNTDILSWAHNKFIFLGKFWIDRPFIFQF